MVQPRTQLPAAVVLLPWAPYHDQGAAGSAAVEPSTPATRQRVSTDGVAVRADGEASAYQSTVLRRRLPPEIAAAGLPVDPLPTVPADDRLPFDEEAVISVAVALDILTTITPELGDAPTVLQQLTEALLYLGELGGAGSKLEALLEHAKSDVGVQRARLARRLATSVEAAAAPSPAAAVTPSTPAQVGAALRQLEAAARLAVREATLLMQAHAPVDYWLA